jgi:uncharacterized protein (DUF1501 family)
MNTPDSYTRRKFLRHTCSAIGSAASVATLFNLRLLNTIAACQPPSYLGDYKALVCLFQLGGSDSFNMLVPNDSSGYSEYVERRGGLAIGGLRPLNLAATGPDLNNWQYGLHPNMPKLANLFNIDGRAAFVANVGSLVTPITSVSELSAAAKPEGLYSHSDQQRFWQTLKEAHDSKTGWAGRLADYLHDAAVDPTANVSMNISLSGSNYLLNGSNVTPYVINPSGAIELKTSQLFPGSQRETAENSIIDSTAVDPYKTVYERTLAGKRRAALDAFDDFSTSVQPLPAATANRFALGENNLADQLHMVARIISANVALGHKRQIFFVSMGGWDHHDELLDAQYAMLGQVDNAVDAFYRATVDLGVANNVTLFSATDFGRTLESNGNGSDHGWGGNVFVVGGSVKGRKIYGKYPRLFAGSGNILDTGRGRFIPTTAIDQYTAELASWFGVSSADLGCIFPNLGEFDGRPDFL